MLFGESNSKSTLKCWSIQSHINKYNNNSLWHLMHIYIYIYNNNNKTNLSLFSFMLPHHRHQWAWDIFGHVSTSLCHEIMFSRDGNLVLRVTLWANNYILKLAHDYLEFFSSLKMTVDTFLRNLFRSISSPLWCV